MLLVLTGDSIKIAATNKFQPPIFQCHIQLRIQAGIYKQTRSVPYSLVLFIQPKTIEKTFSFANYLAKQIFVGAAGSSESL